MTNHDIIHRFAQRTHTDGRANNLFFNDNGKKLYSYGYHYLLCEFLNDNTVLINDSGYSSSTSKHIYITMSATRQYKQFFTTRTDLMTVRNSVMHNKTKLAKARKPEMYINTILSLWKGLNEYIDYMGKNSIKKEFAYKEIKKVVKAINTNSSEYKEKLKAEAIRQEKRQKRADAKELKTKLAKFEAYEIDYFRTGKEDYLRLSEDGKHVETSQRVKVKAENAKMLFELIKKGVDIKGRHIEHYTITSINGTLKIGCHNINMQSVNKVGKLL